MTERIAEKVAEKVTEQVTEKATEKAEELFHGQEKLHEDQEQLQGAQAVLLVEQRTLNDRMIAHLESFENEKELVNAELINLAKWKKQEEGKLRRVVKGLMLFVALWALGSVITGSIIWDTVKNNRQLITRIDTLNRTQADTSYETCLARNKTQKATIDYILRLALFDDEVVKTPLDPKTAKVVIQRATAHRKAITDSGATLTPPATQLEVLDYGLSECMEPVAGATP